VNPTNPDSITAWVQLVGQAGFPVAVAGYLLIRIVPALNRLTSAIEHLVQLAPARRSRAARNITRPAGRRRR